MIFDIESIIKTTGYLGIAAIVFTESGLLIGLFLPGDSLLFTAGFLASQGFLDITVLILVAFVAAVAGDSTGYSLGRRFGPKVFKHQNSLFFDKAHIQRSQAFYEKHGRKTIILARFLPVVRTIAPILAGVGNMHYPTFLSFNVVGGFLWAGGLTLLGYFLGQTVSNIDRYLVPIILIIVALSITPSAIHLLKDKRNRQLLKSSLLSVFRRKSKKH